MALSPHSNIGKVIENWLQIMDEHSIGNYKDGRLNIHQVIASQKMDMDAEEMQIIMGNDRKKK